MLLCTCLRFLTVCFRVIVCVRRTAIRRFSRERNPFFFVGGVLVGIDLTICAGNGERLGYVWYPIANVQQIHTRRMAVFHVQAFASLGKRCVQALLRFDRFGIANLWSLAEEEISMHRSVYFSEINTCCMHCWILFFQKLLEDCFFGIIWLF